MSVAYLFLNVVSYDVEILHADVHRPYAGDVLGFMSIGIVVTKIMTLLERCGAETSGRSVRPQAVGLYHPVGWLQQRAGLLQ